MFFLLMVLEELFASLVRQHSILLSVFTVGELWEELLYLLFQALRSGEESAQQLQPCTS